MRSTGWGLALAGLLALGGCAASAPNRYYTLPVPTVAPSAVPTYMTVGVGPVAIPEMLDRPQILVAGSGNEVKIRETDRWAESLGASVPQVIVAYVAQQLPEARVGASGDVTLGDPDARVLADLIRFQGAPDGGCDVEARWSIVWHDTRRARLNGHFDHHEPSAGEGLDGMASACSRGLGVFAAEIAKGLRTAR